MQNKVITIKMNKDGNFYLLQLPDPSRHAAMSDDFEGDDWKAFAYAKSYAKSFGAVYRPDSKKWLIKGFRDISKLVENLDATSANFGWILEVSEKAKTQNASQVAA